MPATRTRPPFAAHRSLIPTSPLMTVAGVLAHVTWAEQLWFEHAFLGREFDGPR